MFRIELKSVSRGKGASVIAKAAYNARQKLRDERQGLTHDYTKGAEVVLFQGVMVPPGAPDWMKDREKLWNAIDGLEKRKDAETAKSLILTLPREGTWNDRAKLLGQFVAENFRARGFVCDIALHSEPASDGLKNEHAHVLFSERPVDPSSPTGFSAKKDLSKRGPAYVYELRESWEKKYNEYLLKIRAREAPVSAKSEWKVVRDRAREAENAPLPEKLVAVAALKELQTRPPRPRVSGPEYQAAEKRQVRSFGRRRRALEAWRAAVRERRAAVRNFAAGVAQAFPRGFRRVDRLARVVLSYFDRLSSLRPGQPLPPVPFDQHGIWRRPLPPPARGVVKSVVSDVLSWRLWRAPRMREQQIERAAALGRAPERPPERAPEPPKVEAARPRPKPMTLGM